MKRFFLYPAIAFLLTNHIYAQTTVGRHINLDACEFVLHDPFNGRVSVDSESTPHSASYVSTINPKARYPFETWIQFSCENPVSNQIFSDLAGIKMTARGWVMDTSPDVIGDPEVKTTFYPLHGKEWEGGGVTQDDNNGDEARRTRTFAFCIPHKAFAVCGIVRSVGYLQHPNESALPQVIRLLDSIEFVN